MLTATINEVRVSSDAKNVEVIVAFHEEEMGFDQVNVYTWDIAELNKDENENRKKIREFVRERTYEIQASIDRATSLKRHFNDGGLYGMVMEHHEDGLVKVGQAISTADAVNQETPDIGKAVAALE